MEELLGKNISPVRAFKRSDQVEGIVTEKTKKAIYLDIGGKGEAMVIDRELKAAKDFISKLNIGDKVLVIVTEPENDKGQTLLSLKKAAADHLWAFYEEKIKTGESVKVQGFQVNKGGLVVNAQGFQGFIPASQFSSQLLPKIDKQVGSLLEVKVIEVERDKNRLIFSEREISEAALVAEQAKVLKKIKPGVTFSGQISGVMPFGLFVKVKASNTNLEGLVHISEISWEKVEDPNKLFNQGDEVKVKVLDVDRKLGKLALSIKQLSSDPWQEVAKKYQPEVKVKGEVVRLAPFGAFVHLESGVEGLVHISKIPAQKTLKIGDKLDCFVESIDLEHRRLSLGLILKEKPVGYK